MAKMKHVKASNEPLINVLILNIIFMSIKHRTSQLSILKLKLLKLSMPTADRILIIALSLSPSPLASLSWSIFLCAGHNVKHVTPNGSFNPQTDPIK